MRARALTAAVVASLVVLASCGGNGKDTSTEAQTFCSVVTPIQGLGTVTENPDNTKGVQDAMNAVETALSKVTASPPADIKSAVDTVSKTFNAANAALKKANYKFDALAQSDYAAIEALDSADFQKAADEIQTWSSKNCSK